MRVDILDLSDSERPFPGYLRRWNVISSDIVDEYMSRLREANGYDDIRRACRDVAQKVDDYFVGRAGGVLLSLNSAPGTDDKTDLLLDMLSDRGILIYRCALDIIEESPYTDRDRVMINRGWRMAQHSAAVSNNDLRDRGQQLSRLPSK